MPLRAYGASAPQPARPGDLLSVKEVSRMLQLCRRTIYRYVASGVLPQPIRLNQRVIRWKRSDIESFLAAGQTRS